MKKINFTYLIILTGILTLNNLCVTQIKAQTPWKELTVYGNSHVYNNSDNIYSYLTKDKAGNIYAALGRGIFKWNGTSWTELGEGTLNAYAISSIITDNKGNVYAACQFYDRSPQNQVVKWDGSKWSELGSGNTDLNANAAIQSITIDKQGNIYAAGSFFNGTKNAYVAKWNGQFWSELGSESGAGSLPATVEIRSVASDSSGYIYAAGVLNSVYKWDGSQWSSIGSPNFSFTFSLVIDSKTNIYVIDDQYVYEWSGNSWNRLGNASLNPNALALDSKENLYESSQFNAVEKWDGVSWVEVGSGSNAVFEALALTIDNAGNVYTVNINITESYVTKWDGNVWAEVGNINGALDPTYQLNGLTELASVGSIANDKNHNVYAAGGFTDTLGKEYVAKWNGNIWSELGTGANALNANGTINSLATDDAGSVYAAGGFKNGSVRTYVAKWNGVNWSELGGGTIGALFANNTILSIAIDGKGNVYAAGQFTNASGKYYVAKWNGSSWAELGSGATALNAGGVIYSICLDSKGDLYAAGNFRNKDNATYVAKWSGNSWSELAGNGDGDYFNGILTAITSDSSDNIYVSGSTFSLTGVFKWNGSAWSHLGNNIDNIYTLRTDNSGVLYAAGAALDSQKVFVLKWNGSNWSKLGYDFGATNAYGQINSLDVDVTAHKIYAGGAIVNARGYAYVAYNSTNDEDLPLSFISFSIQKKNNSAQLNWQTENEINTSYFNVQRSTDGRNFRTIGKVQAIGNSKLQNNYTYVDDISQVNSGFVFYRLEEVDNDGKFNLSVIKVIELSKNVVLLTISPNPAKDYINIVSSTNINDAKIAITNVNGITLYSSKRSLVKGEQLNIPISSFANQTLFVTIIAGNTTQQFKILKE